MVPTTFLPLKKPPFPIDKITHIHISKPLKNMLLLSTQTELNWCYPPAEIVVSAKFEFEMCAESNISECHNCIYYHFSSLFPPILPSYNSAPSFGSHCNFNFICLLVVDDVAFRILYFIYFGIGERDRGMVSFCVPWCQHQIVLVVDGWLLSVVLKGEESFETLFYRMPAGFFRGNVLIIVRIETLSSQKDF